MNLRKIFAASSLAGLLCVTSTAIGQEGGAGGNSVDHVKLFDSLDQSSPRTRPTAVTSERWSPSTLRQQMALEQARQRAARAEHYAWRGINPSRPNWTAVPMTASAYGPNVIYVPLYYFAR